MRAMMFMSTILLGTVQVNAQNLSFGPTAGLGHSWTNSGIGTADTKMNAYYNLGGKLVYSFVTNWGVSADVKFSGEGHKIESAQGNKSTIRANYVRVPLQGIYFFGKYGDRVRPKISAGPSFGFLAGGKQKPFINEESDVRTKDIWKGLDFGLTVAAGGNVRVAPATWLNLDIAYYHGITDVWESGAKGKNRNLGINVGLTFPLATLRPDDLKR